MRSLFKTLALVAVALVGSGLAAHAFALDHTTAALATGALMAGPLVLAVPKSVDDLIRQTSPSQPGALEAVPWCFYDTQTYTDNVTTTLSFFSTTNADKTLTNMEANASIPSPNYFEIVAFTCDFLVRPSDANAGVVGTLDDMALLQNTGRAQFILTMNQKNYQSVPLRSVGSSGGAVGLIQGTTAANHVEEWATNSIPGANPLRIEKAITIAPNNNFGVTVNFAAAQDINAASINIVIGMWGVYHRKVV